MGTNTPRSEDVFTVQKPITIYLDQCAASQIARNPRWKSLRILLIEQSRTGAAVCPMPYETILESSACDNSDTREGIFSLFREISNGFIFRQFFNIMADELLALVRKGHSCRSFDRTQEIDKLCELSATVGPGYRELKDDFNKMLASWIDSPKPSNMSANSVLKEITIELVGKLWRDLGRIVESGTSIINEEFESGKITPLLLENQITVEEAKKLQEALRHHQMERIPIQMFHNKLAASASLELIRGRGSNISYNDFVDQERLSVALATSDFAITDSAMVNRIGCAGVNSISSCQVFKVADLSKFEEALIHRLHLIK